MVAGNSYADNATDYFIQNDLAAIEAERPDGLSNHNQEYIDWLLAQGYSPTSIIMSSVGRGLTLADTIFMMSRSQPESVENYYKTAESLLPSLPGWVCSTANAMGHRYDKPLDRDSLGDSSSLARVAKLYFEENERFVKAPDWQNGMGHINANVDELIKYKQMEIDRVSPEDDDPIDSWWYLDQLDGKRTVVSASLFPKDQRIILDARLSDLLAMKQSGASSVPVMFMYNDNGHVPMSDVERVPGELYGGSTMKQDEIDYIDYDDGEITATEVINLFEARGDRIPPAREWRLGDHHLMVRTDELSKLFTIPEKEDIDPEFWKRSSEKLAKSTINPIHITLVSGAKGERWLDNRSLVAVAKEKGIERLPAVFFYHGVERQACGMPSACLPDIKAAAIAGSQCPDCFDECPECVGGKPPFGGPPVIVPPVAGPISPN